MSFGSKKILKSAVFYKQHCTHRNTSSVEF